MVTGVAPRDRIGQDTIEFRVGAQQVSALHRWRGQNPRLDLPIKRIRYLVEQGIAEAEVAWIQLIELRRVIRQVRALVSGVRDFRDNVASETALDREVPLLIVRRHHRLRPWAV